MKRTLTVLMLVALVALPCLAQSGQPAPAEKMPSVDQIIAKYVDALGGKAALEKVNSRFQKGTLEIPGAGLGGTFEAYQKAPNKSIFTANIDGFGLVQEGYDGTVAWAQDPQSGLREKTGGELADVKRDSDIHRDLKLKALYPTMTLKGKEKIGEKEVYVIEAKPAEGNTEKWYFDAQSGLLARADTERESPMGKALIESYFENYKDVDGVKIPTTVRQVTPAFTIVVQFSETQHNVSVEDSKFTKPKS